MALDEPKDADDVYDIDGFKYLVDKDFMERANPIKVDFQEIGFKLTSSIQMNDECSGCGSTSSCG